MPKANQAMILLAQTIDVTADNLITISSHNESGTAKIRMTEMGAATAVSLLTAGLYHAYSSLSPEVKSQVSYDSFIVSITASLNELHNRK